MLAGKLFHRNVVFSFLNILVNCLWFSITQTIISAESRYMYKQIGILYIMF